MNEYSLISDSSSLSHLSETYGRYCPGFSYPFSNPSQPGPAIAIVILILHVTRTMVVALLVRISPSLGSR